MELTAQNTIPTNIVNTILTGQLPSTLLGKINLTRWLRYRGKTDTINCGKVNWCRQKRMAEEKKSIKNFKAVAPTVLEILPIKEIMLVKKVEPTFAGFSNFDPTFMNSK